MFTRLTFGSVVLSSFALMIGCGNSPSDSSTPVASTASDSPSPDGEKFVLSKEPDGGKGVIDARKDVKDGDDVVIVGRIGGEVKPWVDGRASFLIVDSSLKPCNETGDDGCETPWDYCCALDQLENARASVKFVDAQGQTIPLDARKLLGVKELQTIVVQGKAKRDDAGNLTVLATGLFLRP